MTTETAGSVSTKAATRAPEWKRHMLNTATRAILTNLDRDIEDIFFSWECGEMSNVALAVALYKVTTDAEDLINAAQEQYS